MFSNSVLLNSLSTMVVLILAGPLQAQVTLSSFSSSYLKIGEKSVLKINGSTPNWPISIWFDRQGVTAKPLEKGEIEFNVPENAIPGIYHVRLRDGHGVSEPVPMVIDYLDAATEVEPNGSIDESQKFGSAVAVSADLAKNGDVDCYSLSLKKNTTLVASMLGNPSLGQSMDGVLQVCDTNGFVLAQNDDTKGVDPQITIDIPADGTYTVRVFAFPAAPNSSIRFAGGTDYRYILRMTDGPFLDFRLPLPAWTAAKQHPVIRAWNFQQSQKGHVVRLPSDQDLLYVPGLANQLVLKPGNSEGQVLVEAEVDSRKPLLVPWDLTGEISEVGESDFFVFKGTKGTKIRFDVDSRNHGFDLDPIATIYDAKGKELIEKDDRSKTDPDLTLDFVPPSDGQYLIKIRDASDSGGDRFPYRLRANPVQADFQLMLNASKFRIDEKKTLEIEVSINRIDGFDQGIEIYCTGLPDFVKVESVRSEPKGDSQKKVKLKLEARTDENFQGTFQITGALKDQRRQAQFKLPSGHRLCNPFLTIGTVK